MSEPRFETRDISPAMATLMLQKNSHNRHPKPKVVDMLAGEMTAGRWKFTGDPIKLDSSGVVIDGQHRLMALVKSNTTQKMLVMLDAPMEIQTVLDTGARRSFSDTLALNGETQVAAKAALTTALFRWVHGWRFSGNSVKLSNDILLAFYIDYIDLVAAGVAAARRVRDAGILANPTVIGVLWTVMDGIDHADASYFFERLRDGVGLEGDSPILKVRNRIAMERQRISGDASQVWEAAILIKAWNAFRDGKTMQAISWRPGGSSPESFPEPH